MSKNGNRTRIFAGMFFPFLLFGATLTSLVADKAAASPPAPGLNPTTFLEQEVRQQLATLNYYAVFDHVTFSVGAPGTVILGGEVTRAGLKSDAEAAVRNVKNVTKIVNDIEVLPISPTDDSIRWAAFKAIFDKPELQQYAIQKIAPLRIVVRNGEITLDGKVASEFDRTLIDMSARSVPEAAGVIDNIVVH